MQAEWKFSVGSKWQDTGYLLVNEFGEPIFPRNPSRWFIDFIKNLDGVHRITFHQLRHTHVALLAHLGIDIHKISKKVGHSEETTTLRTYMHILEKTEHNESIYFIRKRKSKTVFYVNFTSTALFKKKER